MSTTETKSPDQDKEFRPAVPNLSAEKPEGTVPATAVDGHTSEAIVDLTGPEPVIQLVDDPTPEHSTPAPVEPHAEAAQPTGAPVEQHMQSSPAVSDTQTEVTPSGHPQAETPSPEPRKKGVLGTLRSIFSHGEDSDRPIYPPVEAGMPTGFDPTTLNTEMRAAARDHAQKAPEPGKEQ